MAATTENSVQSSPNIQESLLGSEAAAAKATASASSLVRVQPRLTAGQAFLKSPQADLIVASQLSVANSVVHPIRKRSKGLLESRRGSRTTLTISLSPSVESIAPDGRKRSPSPIRKDSAEKSHLETASCSLSALRLRAKCRDKEALFEEFWRIPMNSAHKDELRIAHSHGLIYKNRYESFPNEHSRVELPKIGEDTLSTYINANYIRGYNKRPQSYIATEGPMQSTLIDFWRMVWHTRSELIVMITDFVEKNKKKCEVYFPQDARASPMELGGIRVTLERVQEEEHLEIRHFRLEQCATEQREREGYKEGHKEEGGQPRKCVHLWYKRWPDNEAPRSCEPVLRMAALCEELSRPDGALRDRRERDTCEPGEKEQEKEKEEEQQEEEAEHHPIIVHCSAGLGRTGSFIAILIGQQQITETARAAEAATAGGEVGEGGGVCVDVLRIAAGMRQDRGRLISNHEQYEFVHRALARLCEQRGLLQPAEPDLVGGHVHADADEVTSEPEAPPPLMSPGGIAGGGGGDRAHVRLADTKHSFSFSSPSPSTCAALIDEGGEFFCETETNKIAADVTAASNAIAQPTAPPPNTKINDDNDCATHASPASTSSPALSPFFARRPPS